MEAVAHKTLKRGFSLIEAAIVLGVVGAVIGTIWVSAANMYESYKVNKTAEDIFTIARNIQNLISFRDAESIGDGINITFTAWEAGVYPKDWINRTTHIDSIFWGETRIFVYKTDPRFYIFLNSVNRSSCIKMIIKISSIGSMAGSRGSGAHGRNALGYLEVNGSSNWNTTNFPVSTDTAVIACNQENNDMQFGFGYTRIN